MIKIFVIIFTFSIPIFALDFIPGSGSQFNLNTQGQNVELNIYVADRKDSSLSIEMHFGAGGIIPMNMYQQFEFEFIGANKPIKIEKGYMLTDKVKHPEIMSAGFFKQNKGVQVQDFLFSKTKDIQKDFIADEVVETPAGAVIAKHYQKKRNGQTVDFWISEEVGPISLVKLNSKSDKDLKQNYSIELLSLVQNVKATIDPKKARPMSESTKKTFKIKD